MTVWANDTPLKDTLPEFLNQLEGHIAEAPTSEHVNVKAAPYLAQGDGVADDTAAIEAAIDAANANGGTVFFPGGTYKVTSTIDLSDYALLSWEGGHLGPAGLISGIRPPAVVIDGTSMSSGACVSSDRAGGTANYTMRNIVFRGKDQGFKLKDAGVAYFDNCGFTCSTTGADSCGLFILNCFWLTFDFCTMHSASNTLPSVRMRGDATAINVNSSSGQFRNCTFFSGGVQFEHNTTPTNGGSGVFYNCIVENSAMAMVTFIEGGGVAGFISTGPTAINCQIADPVGSPPLIRVNSAGCQLFAPIVGAPVAGTYTRAIQIDSGAVWGAQLQGNVHVTDSSGVPYVGGATVGGFQAQKVNGFTWVGNSPSLSETSLTGSAGAFIKMGRSGDLYSRAGFDTDGTYYWGPGGATSTGYDTNLYRSAADTLKTDDKMIAGAGIGVGNSAAASSLGTVTDKMEVFDASGNSLGFVPIYDAIT